MPRRLLLTLLLWAATPTGQADSPLAPGARSNDCRSALLIGPAHCEPAIEASARERRAEERQVDAFLARYGKPPREAVRALLDPSDDNILAWLHSQNETLARANYVARRMSALQSQLDTRSARIGPLGARDRAPMTSVRATLYARDLDAATLAGARSLGELQRRHPRLDARLVRLAPAGTEAPRVPPQWVATLGTRVPIDTVAADVAEAADLPQLWVEDLRNGSRRSLHAPSLDEASIEQAIEELREGAGPRVGAAPGAAP